MFNESKYTKWYMTIIFKAKFRELLNDGCYEKHHIIPKSLGGSNNETNLVKLTPKEHFICHLLLIRMVSGNNKRKMVYAAWQLGSRTKQLTSYSYHKLKQQLSETYTGHTHSLETKLKMSLSKKGKYVGDKNPNYGNKWTDEARKKMSNIKKGKSTGINNPFFGKTHTEEVKNKISQSNKKFFTCPKCGKIGQSNSMKRWHFANCSST